MNLEEPARTLGPGAVGVSLAVCALALGLGVALVATDAPGVPILALAACAAAIAPLVLWPELTLALYVVVGDVKGDERIVSLGGLDLTLALGAILLAGVALHLVRRKRIVPLPSAFFLYLALVAIMAASLAYTPVLDAGLEKLGRFLTMTGIVIVAPFFVLGTPRAMKRFLVGYGVSALAICGYSLTRLGGAERLTTPSNFTIGLGHIACASILLIWFGPMARLPFRKRIVLYPLLALPLVALLGSGSRGPLIALALVIAASLVWRRKQLADAAFLAAAAILAFPFIGIPPGSVGYLSTLVDLRGAGSLLNFRAELMSQAWKLIEQHPLLGAGLQGYRYASPNAALYNWPHNIFLELACELGIPAAIIACAIFGSAAYESLRQLKDRLSPHLALSEIAAALCFAGVVNAVNTGDINSDRATWLFLSLVFVAGALRKQSVEKRELAPRGHASY